MEAYSHTLEELNGRVERWQFDSSNNWFSWVDFNYQNCVLSPIVEREALQLKVVAEIKILQLTATLNFNELLVFNCQFKSAVIQYKQHVDWTLCCHNINYLFSQRFQLLICHGVVISPWKRQTADRSRPTVQSVSNLRIRRPNESFFTISSSRRSHLCSSSSFEKELK